MSSVQANELTQNVLIRFDPAVIDASSLVDRVGDLEPHKLAPRHDSVLSQRPSVLRERLGEHHRLRVTVRGLDRDPDLGRRVVEQLEQRHGVHATASPLTGRVLIELGHHLTEIEEIIAEIEHLEMPDMPGEDRPRHPLDPAPLYQSAVRVVGAALGLGFVVGRRLLGTHGSAQSVSRAARTAGLLGLVQGFPFIRSGLRSLLGRSLSDVLLYAPVMASLAMSESVLGLAVTGIESARLLSEIVSRRAQFRRYEDRLGDAPATHPGAVVRVDAGQRAPRNGTILEGSGMAVTRDGLPRPVQPGDVVHAGARLHGGPFVLELGSAAAFEPRPRPAPPAPRLYDKYVAAVGLASLGYAVVHTLWKRSLGGLLEALLLVNPRAAVIGNDLADVSALSRVLRAGVTVVDTRGQRPLRQPDLLLLDNPRMLTQGLEISRVLSLNDIYDSAQVLGHAASIAAAAGGPWGGALANLAQRPAEDPVFEDGSVVAVLDGRRWRLTTVPSHPGVPPAVALQHRGEACIVVAEAVGVNDWLDVGLILMRPRLAPGLDALVARCERHGIEMAFLCADDVAAAEALAARSHVALLTGLAPTELIASRQQAGQRVFFVSDNARSAEAFANCDMAIGISSGRSGRFLARADLLSPDLAGVNAIIEASVRRRLAVRGAVAASLVGNVVAAIWGLRSDVRPERASVPVYLAAIASSLFGAFCMRGGERQRSVMAELSDPRPEKWGARSVESLIGTLRTSRHGLTSEQAATRRRARGEGPRFDEAWRILFDQFSSPMQAILLGAGGLALGLGAWLDVAVIAGTITMNVVVGAWQERQAGRAAEAMKRVAAPAANVLRDGQVRRVQAAEVVPGDVLVLAPGDRVSADARVITAHALEVDEASLTGESLPVLKAPAAHQHAARVVMEGSDVVCGHGRAVVFAVGRQTRLGATAAALALDESQHTPLGKRLARLLRQVLPLATAGGAMVFASGLLRGQPVLSQLGIAASIALAAVPEGLPLLSGVGQVAVARRLEKRQALVRRLTAVEALGRVDVACTDKTGTLTVGKLEVVLAADLDDEAPISSGMAGPLGDVLRTAAWASPHPDAADAAAHPTDAAVLRAADEAGMHHLVRLSRTRSAPFDPSRSFHAAEVEGRMRLKGAPEVISRLATRLRIDGQERPLDPGLRERLMHRADALARRGLRVLMVAEGSGELDPDRPTDLTALGFIGIRDPLREDARPAMDTCHKAGIRVIMLTGDHPSTARTIADEAGLPEGMLTGGEIEKLSDEELDARLEHVAVVARATPLDKLRIIEGLQRRGHVVAMTGDGVNDAPALRLADVGVAMGRSGTEVARQAADLVLGDDDFATLVEAFIEGRSFWANMRRSLGLLLGGNLGELGLVCGASMLGFPAPLTTRQILAVNLITDAVPAMSVVLQKPRHNHLEELQREGVHAMDNSLRTDAVRRAISTMLPAIVNYLTVMRGGGNLVEARTLAFSSIVMTQLSQTLDAGWAQGRITAPVMKAIAASGTLLVAGVSVRPVAALFGLAMPAGGWMMSVVAGASAVILNRALSAGGLRATHTDAAPRPHLTPWRALPSPT